MVSSQASRAQGMEMRDEEMARTLNCGIIFVDEVTLN